MAYEKKPNRGYFGKNKKKTTDKQPDYTGSLLIGDDVFQQLVQAKQSGKPIMMFLSGWKSTPQGGGDPYISLACNAAMEQRPAQQSAPARKPAASSQVNDSDDDIPF